MRVRTHGGVFLLAAIAFTDIRPAAQQILLSLGIRAESFPAWINRIDSDTDRREREGESDHLIYYILQSRQFTGAAPVEPALSAKEFIDTGKIAPIVLRRFQDFLKARVAGERMVYLRRMIPSAGDLPYLNTEYTRAMRSLYEKEFVGNAGFNPGFYQTRGHSTDTQVPANYAVWTAISVLHGMHPELRIRRVLIVGPGLDFAPRTSLDDRYPPQSYQPWAVADALLSTGLSVNPAIHCIDINDRVIDFFLNFPRRHPPILHLLSPPGDADYLDYFNGLGRAIGEVRRNGPLDKEVRLRQGIAESVTAEKMNVITHRSSAATNSGGTYDLVVATNVFVYFNNAELLLALSNVSAMMTPGAYLIHNEFRPEMDVYAGAAGLRPVGSRTIRVATGARAPLFDGYSLLQK